MNILGYEDGYVVGLAKSNVSIHDPCQESWRSAIAVSASVPCSRRAAGETEVSVKVFAGVPKLAEYDSQLQVSAPRTYPMAWFKDAQRGAPDVLLDSQHQGLVLYGHSPQTPIHNVQQTLQCCHLKQCVIDLGL